MKKLVFTIVCLFIGMVSYCQFKVVKIALEDIYLNYFYKKRQTKRNKNDSTFFVCKTISPTIFFLEKYINGKRLYQKNTEQ